MVCHIMWQRKQSYGYVLIEQHLNQAALLPGKIHKQIYNR